MMEGWLSFAAFVSLLVAADEVLHNQYNEWTWFKAVRELGSFALAGVFLVAAGIILWSRP